MMHADKLRAEGIFACFSREEERAFLFPGGANPMLELLYVESGCLHSVTDGKKLLLQEGELVIYGPNQWHMQYADVGEAPRCVRIFFDVQRSLLPLLSRKWTASEIVKHLIHQMLQEQEEGQPFAAQMMGVLLNQLVLLLLRQAEQMNAEKCEISGEQKIIHRTLVYICGHVWEELSVPFVARHVNMSPSYLTALFHKHLGISPGEYIRRVKLQESKRLIRENKLNFTQIAELLQYSTVHQVSRQFKEKFGMTPSDYAQQVR